MPGQAYLTSDPLWVEGAQFKCAKCPKDWASPQQATGSTPSPPAQADKSTASASPA